VLGNLEDAETFKIDYASLGQSVTKLKWINSNDEMSTKESLKELFGLMANLKFLEMKNWKNEFPEKFAVELNITELESLKLQDCKPFILDFFSESLPRDILKEFVTNRKVPDEVLSNFVNKQTNIKNLEIRSYYTQPRLLKNLTLERFKCDFKIGKSPKEQQNFLIEVFKSQPKLNELDLTSGDYNFAFLNDEVFKELCKLKELKSLKFNIDGLSIEVLGQLAKLKQLKSLEIVTNDANDNGLLLFKALSLVKMRSLESFEFNLWEFKLTTEIYEKFSRNLINLKSLKISLGVQQKLNVFILNFPHLETLDLVFGSTNQLFEFSQAFDDDEQQHPKIKNLTLEIKLAREVIDTEMFMKMIKAFPNLETLTVKAKFPFKTNFFLTLAENLEGIQNLHLNHFVIACNEDFSKEVMESIKDVKEKLYSSTFVLMNSVKHLSGDFCLMKGEDGKLETKQISQRRHAGQKLSFQPIIETLKEDFVADESNLTSIETRNFLTLTSRKE
jgi:hypothetical protein